MICIILTDNRMSDTLTRYLQNYKNMDTLKIFDDVRKSYRFHLTGYTLIICIKFKKKKIIFIF